MTLANVDPVEAEAIVLGFMIGSTNGTLQGSFGDDVLIASKFSADRVVVGASSGHDYLTYFMSDDVLAFEDGIVPVWSDSMVNGLPVLVGKWNGGSLTIEGYSTASLSTIQMDGPLGPPITTDAGLSAWSVASDADYFF